MIENERNEKYNKEEYLKRMGVNALSNFYKKKHSTFSEMRNALVASLIVLIPFIILALLGQFATEWLNQIDYNIGSIFYSMRTLERTQVAIGITTLADFWAQTAFTIVVMLILLSIKKWKASLWFGLTVLLGSEYLNTFAKDAFQRIRPEFVEQLIAQDGYAFPSGHAMGSMIILGGIIFLIYKYHSRKTSLKIIVTVLCSLFILFIGCSRIYLGVHYPSDVLAGFSLGAFWLLFSIGTVGMRTI